MQEKTNILTEEGIRKYEQELKDLKSKLNSDISQKLKVALEQGDLSENAEYDAAKDEQARIAARIEQLEKLLKRAEVIVEDEIDTSVINVGCIVRIHDMEMDEDLEYKIVGSHEANSLGGMISNESPVGRALIGHKQNEIVEVETMAGVLRFKVLEIKKSTDVEKK